VLYWRLNAIKRPAVLLVLAASLAVFTNWLRVFVITVAGYMTNMQHYLVRVDHYRFGWVVFAIAMGVFFLLAARMAGGVPNELVIAPNREVARSKVQWSALVLLAIVIGPLWQLSLYLRDRGSELSSDVIAPPPGWSVVPNAASTWNPIFANADYRDLTKFSHDSTTVEMFRVLYTDQRQAKKLASFGNSIIGTGLQDNFETVAAQSLPGFSSLVVSDAHGKRWIILHTYFVGERRFGTALNAQVFYGVSSIFARNRVGVLAVRSECVVSCEATQAMLASFVRALSIEPALPLGTD
jgi:exosortase/archaeosortase family protein